MAAPRVCPGGRSPPSARTRTASICCTRRSCSWSGSTCCRPLGSAPARRLGARLAAGARGAGVARGRLGLLPPRRAAAHDAGRSPAAAYAGSWRGSRPRPRSSRTGKSKTTSCSVAILAEAEAAVARQDRRVRLDVEGADDCASRRRRTATAWAVLSARWPDPGRGTARSTPVSIVSSLRGRPVAGNSDVKPTIVSPSHAPITCQGSTSDDRITAYGIGSAPPLWSGSVGEQPRRTRHRTPASRSSSTSSAMAADHDAGRRGRTGPAASRAREVELAEHVALGQRQAVS